MNRFAHLELAPPDPILGTTIAFNNDKSPEKMNLGVGAYRTNEGKPYIFQAVREAETRILNDSTVNKEYLPIDGLKAFCDLSRELILGSDCPAIAEGRVVTSQAISGTGSLRIGADFIAAYLNRPLVYVSNPTWGNHNAIFNNAGLEVRAYPYWKESTRGLDFAGMTAALNEAPENSVILLHACAHNPTGVDLTQQQWEQLAELMQRKNLLPYFDSAYQGFATGDLERDAFAIRLFVRLGFQCLISQSYAKNMGLYGERAGALHIVCTDKDTADRVLSQLKLVIRPMYSSPPLHGALIVARILSDQQLRQSWYQELKEVSERIISMRASLRAELEALRVPGDWSHITSQIGMFSYTGLNAAQCDVLINKWHCYLLRNGRISMSGINTTNYQYLARAIQDAVQSVPTSRL